MSNPEKDPPMISSRNRSRRNLEAHLARMQVRLEEKNQEIQTLKAALALMGGQVKVRSVKDRTDSLFTGSTGRVMEMGEALIPFLLPEGWESAGRFPITEEGGAQYLVVQVKRPKGR